MDGRRRGQSGREAGMVIANIHSAEALCIRPVDEGAGNRAHLGGCETEDKRDDTRTAFVKRPRYKMSTNPSCSSHGKNQARADARSNRRTFCARASGISIRPGNIVVLTSCRAASPATPNISSMWSKHNASLQLPYLLPYFCGCLASCTQTFVHAV